MLFMVCVLKSHVTIKVMKKGYQFNKDILDNNHNKWVMNCLHTFLYIRKYLLYKLYDSLIVNVFIRNVIFRIVQEKP